MRCPQMQRLRAGRPQGFTRKELVATLAFLFLLIAVSLAAITSSKPSNQRALCRSNLRENGQAVSRWATDHDGRVPWLVSTAEGGSGGGIPPAFFYILPLSNYLASPRTLACPADTNLVATNWDFNPGGFLFFGFRDKALSYFVGLDTPLEEAHAILFGDRSLYTPAFTYCARVKVIAADIVPQAAWGFPTPGAHGDAGHFLFTDGRVELYRGTLSVGSGFPIPLPNQFHIQKPQ